MQLADSRAPPLEGPTPQVWDMPRNLYYLHAPQGIPRWRVLEPDFKKSLFSCQQIIKTFPCTVRQKFRLNLKSVELLAVSGKSHILPHFAHWLSASVARKQAKQDGAWNWRLSHPTFNSTLVIASTHPQAGQQEPAGHTLLTSKATLRDPGLQFPLEAPDPCLELWQPCFPSNPSSSSCSTSWVHTFQLSLELLLPEGPSSM